MSGFETFPVSGDGGALKPGLVIGDLSFQTNAGSNPASTTWTGSLAGFVKSITYAATGKYTIVFKTGFVFVEMPVIKCSSNCADVTVTNRFWATVSGVPTQSAGVLTVVVQTLQEGTAFQVPNTAGNRVNVTIASINNGGK